MSLHFEENHAAGSPRDFIEARHLKIRGSNYQIGRKLADIARERHDVLKVPHTDPLRTKAQLRWLEVNYPIHLERVRGVANSYGMELDNYDVDFAHLNYLMGLPGCSAIYYPSNTTESEHGILSRTFDFPVGTFKEALGVVPEHSEQPSTSRPYIMEVYPDKGYPALFLSIFDLLGSCMDGINSEGLTVALVADHESIMKRRIEPSELNAVGLAEIQITRMIMDTCANVEEAKLALLTTKQYYRFIPLHFLIADRFGKSFLWEYSFFHNREYILDGEPGIPQVKTNHPLHKYPSLDKLPKHGASDHTYNRFRKLIGLISGHTGRFTEDEIWNITRCNQMTADDPESPNNKLEYPWRTMWHNVYDIDQRRMEVDFFLGDKRDPEDSNKMKSIRSDLSEFQLEV